MGTQRVTKTECPLCDIELWVTLGILWGYHRGTQAHGEKFIQRMELQEKNMFVPEIRGESRNAHASLSVPYVTLDCLSPTHVCVCAFCVLWRRCL